MKILLYTFESFSGKERFEGIFIFKKLKEDLKKFESIILQEKPEIILGLANARFSRMENRALNQFNKAKKVSKSGKEYYDLHTSLFSKYFKTNKSSTDSFCNWTMYKVSEFIDRQKLETKLSFIHLSQKDIELLRKVL